MEKLNLTDKVKDNINEYINGLKNIYQQGLISVILYGSAASGEFTDKYSNVNILIVLNDVSLENLARASSFVNKHKFEKIKPIFFSENYINTSCDVFPIEFLDMQENYLVLFGRDVLRDLSVDIKNLRFQCEQELKAKLINIKLSYLRNKGNKIALKNLLFKSYTSVLHILRNVLRLKGKKPPYKKEDILRELALEFKIDMDIWQNILVGKFKQIKLSSKDAQDLFINFVRELEKIVEIVDKL